jgi:ribonucleoside-diphosphate reductase alpha chain
MTVPAQVAMPRRRAGHTTAVTIGGERLRLTANAAADGSLGEVFIHWGKHGSGPAGLMDLYASALSMGLRCGVPLADLVRSGLGQRFAPDGRTDDPDIPRAGSVADYVARRLAIDWLPLDERASLGIYTRAELLGLAGPRPAGPLPGDSRPAGPRPDGPRPDGPRAAGPRPDGPRAAGTRPASGEIKAAIAPVLVEQGADVVGV